jgi:hypothetical protein
MAAENVSVGGSPLFEGVLERAGNVLLPDDLGELLWTVFARQDGVAHESENTIIRDRGLAGAAICARGPFGKSEADKTTQLGFVC